MSEYVDVTEAPGRIEVAMNRPDKKNAITDAMYAAMADAMAMAEQRRDVRAIVFSGRGAAFTAGNDLQDFLTADGKERAVGRFLNALATTSKALVAAVQGNAVGIGSTMLLHCDYVVVAKSARLQFAFAKMGLVPEAASSLLLPRLVGPMLAARLMLSAETIPADNAFAWGLASELVEDGQELPAARAFAEKLNVLPPLALQRTKKLLKADVDVVLERMSQEGRVFAESLAGPEFKEAATAFMEKRAPDFAKLQGPQT